MISKESLKLLDHLMSCNKLTADYKEIILTEYEKKTKRSLESILLDLNIVTEDEILTWLSEFRQCSVVSLADYKDNIKNLAFLLPYSLLETCLAVPIEHTPEFQTLKIAMADVSDIQAYDLLKQNLSNYELVTVMAKKSDILTALQDIAPSTSIQSTIHCTIDDQVINQFLHQLIVEAVKVRASDIHFEPEKFLIRVRYRCDGILKTVCCFHDSFWQPFCIQLKILASIDIAETRNPQDGRFSLSIMGRHVDFRASTHPTLFGQNIVLRILDKEKSLILLESLGYSAHNLEKIYDLLKKPEGIIVMTGPTGSGKTTSLYGMLSILNAEKLNIMTLEEPIEYHLPHIRQSEVREQSSFNFFAGMHSILRQDPDVILIGEIRDEQTADMAIRAGMTGHLVLTTLHTVHALATIYRLTELKVPVSLLAGVLNGLIAQRLIRLLCQNCKEKTEISPQQAQHYRIWPQTFVYQPRGCSLCSQGYQGRKAIAEVIILDNNLEELILENASYGQLRKYLAQKGFKSLIEDGITSVLNGETSLEELSRVVGV